MTERTATLMEDGHPLLGKTERLVSVPWCTVHDAPYKGHPDLDAPMCLYAAWAVVDRPSLVGSCVIEDGVVWKVAE